MSRAGVLALVVCVLVGLPLLSFADDLAGIRGSTPLTADHAIVSPPALALPDERQPRSSYDSPPVIPHPIIGYQLDAQKNDCLSCHGRAVTAETPGAPMSITHFSDREGKVLASLAARRYFCTQCHLIQTLASPPISNDYHVFATSRRYICLKCHLPQPEDVPSGATVSHGAGVVR